MAGSTKGNPKVMLPSSVLSQNIQKTSLQEQSSVQQATKGYNSNWQIPGAPFYTAHGYGRNYIYTIAGSSLYPIFASALHDKDHDCHLTDVETRAERRQVS